MERLRALVAQVVGCRVVPYESRVQGFRCLTSTIVSKVLELKDALAQTLKSTLHALYPTSYSECSRTLTFENL